MESKCDEGKSIWEFGSLHTINALSKSEKEGNEERVSKEEEKEKKEKKKEEDGEGRRRKIKAGSHE